MRPPHSITPRLPTSKREAAPRTVLYLAYGGLLPFVGLMVASLFDPARLGVWQQFSLNYGAVILSFVGALHWGFAMQSAVMSERKRNGCLIWSVLPALLAWLALALDPLAGSALLAAGLGVHYLQDWRLDRYADLPGWYLPLRLTLSATAAMCLLVTSLVGYL